MKFGIWTYTGDYVDLRQIPQEDVVMSTEDGLDVEFMENGMDLSFYYRSAEWDLLALSSTRHSVLYASCCGPEKYVDITYRFLIRRKTLFYTCNLIIPCFLISFLTTFVFYLSDHKITFSISILVTLTVFFLVLIDIVPPTSLVIPMFGRYLVTTMILVALSTMISVVSVNFRFRSGTTTKMSPWIKTVFLNWLPKLLLINQPENKPKKENPEQQHDKKLPLNLNNFPTTSTYINSTKFSPINDNNVIWKRTGNSPILLKDFNGKDVLSREDDHEVVRNQWSKGNDRKFPPIDHNANSMMFGTKKKIPGVYWEDKKAERKFVAKTNSVQNEVQRLNKLIFNNMIRQVRFITDHFVQVEEESELETSWTFVALVLDRLFLIIFSILNVATLFILLDAPTIRDGRSPMNITIPMRPLGQANLSS